MNAGSLRGTPSTSLCDAFVDDLASKMAAAQPLEKWQGDAGKAAAKALLVNGTMGSKPEDPDSFVYALVQPANSAMFEGIFWEFDRKYALMLNLEDVTKGANKFTDFQTKFGVVAGIDNVSTSVGQSGSDDISQGACGTSKFNQFWDAFSLAFTRITMVQHESRYLTNGVWTKPVTVLISAPINKTATDTDDLEESYFLDTEVAAMKKWSDDMGVAAPPILLLNLRTNCDAIEQVFAIRFHDLSVACKYCTGGDWTSCAADAFLPPREA